MEKNKIKKLLITLLCIPILVFGQKTYVPDDNFEQALIDLGLDIILDDSVLTSSIDTVIQLDVTNKNISDLTGIEYFMALKVLSCGGNPMTTIDISQNINLTNFGCINNNLTSLNVQNNTLLESLILVSFTNSGMLTNLDLSNNPALTYLRFDNNQLTNLDLSNNTLLGYLYCDGNQITSLDVSNNTNLRRLSCSGNQISTLDVSSLPLLYELSCHVNQLTSLDLRNGNNLNYGGVNIKDNPNLYCINVDDPAWSTANWTSGIDAQAYFVSDCNLVGCTDPTALNYDSTATTDNGSCNYQMTYVPDDNFEQALIDLGIDDILDDSVMTSNINSITYLPVSNKNISDLTGIEDFIALNYLYCYDNALLSLDISNNIHLKELHCYRNYLTSLDIHNNIALQRLDVGDNSISTLDLSANINLDFLQIYGNQFSNLDVTNNLVLTVLLCENNQLNSIDVSNNIALVGLGLSSNQLTNIDVSQNIALTWLSCASNQITNLDVSQNIILNTLSCGNNQLTSLDVSHNTDLQHLDCYTNQLTTLDLSNNILLEKLFCQNNQISDLDMSSNTILDYLDLQSNQVINLDLSNNTVLTHLNCYNNQLISLDLRNGNNVNLYFAATNNPNLYCIDVDDPTWSTANWTNIDAQAYFSTDCAVYGCTDPTAANYDANANTDDGSCISLEIDTAFIPHPILCYGEFAEIQVNVNQSTPTSTYSCVIGFYFNNTEYFISSASSGQTNDTQLNLYGFSPNIDYIVRIVDSTAYYSANFGLSNGVSTVGVFDEFGPINFYEPPAVVFTDSIIACDPYIWDGDTIISSGIYSKIFTTTLGCDSTVNLNLTIQSSGCTDPSASNYDSSAGCDDGSCTYSSSCSIIYPISGLYVDNIIDDRAVLHFDNMNTYDANGNQICRVDQIRIKYREVGTSTWSQKNIASPTGYDANGVCNSTQKTDKNIYGLTLATTYEWRVKLWYCSGQVTSWVNGPNFTTAGECPNVGNFTAYGANPTKATFNWQPSNGLYEFVRIKMRLDAITNPQSSDWFNVGGAGISYGTFTKDKNGLTPGETYRGQARTWCDPNGGAYNALSWTAPPIVWTQPTNRIDGGESIKNLDIFPNPSRDMFNITFTSEDVQDLRVVVRNVIGEELIVEDLQQFVGEYTKKINLKDNAKGIYLLEIETNEGVINKKLILQ